jgi:hypothetical protein
MIHRPCNFVHHKFYFPLSVFALRVTLDDPFGNSGQTVIDPNSDPTATQLNQSTEYGSA